MLIYLTNPSNLIYIRSNYKKANPIDHQHLSDHIIADTAYKLLQDAGTHKLWSTRVTISREQANLQVQRT
jgi:hypothetical protein